MVYFQVIDPLPDVDHSQIQYPVFNKNFYEEHEDIKSVLFQSNSTNTFVFVADASSTWTSSVSRIP